MSPRLAAQRSGAGPSRAVLVHGFSQSAGSWESIVEVLAGDIEVVAVDAPNHGGSTGVTAAGLGEAARLVTDAGGTGTYVGYSMGGRIALRAALDHPGTVRSLVLVSATAGIADAAARRARRAADLAMAERLDPVAAGVSAVPLRQFLEEWLSGPLFATLGGEQAALEARLVNTGAGLARSLRTIGTGSMVPLWDRLASITMPVAVVVGELDGKFTAIGAQLVAAIGENAELHVVPRSGHAVPFERPDDLMAVIRAHVPGPAAQTGHANPAAVIRAHGLTGRVPR